MIFIWTCSCYFLSHRRYKKPAEQFQFVFFYYLQSCHDFRMKCSAKTSANETRGYLPNMMEMHWPVHIISTFYRLCNCCRHSRGFMDTPRTGRLHLLSYRQERQLAKECWRVSVRTTLSTLACEARVLESWLINRQTMSMSWIWAAYHLHVDDHTKVQYWYEGITLRV